VEEPGGMFPVENLDPTIVLTSRREGEATTSGDSRKIRIQITGESTEGRYSIVEDTVPAGYGPPLHMHKTTSEAFYIIRGALRFQVGTAKVIEAPAGSFLFIPRGIAHAFINPTSEPATYILVISPSGFEKYFEALARIIDTNPTPETLADLSARHDRYVVGPRMAS